MVRSFSTWSRISESSGETTRTVPSIRAPAAWNARLLPAPVGMIPSEFCPSIVRWIRASCAGRGSTPNRARTAAAREVSCIHRESATVHANWRHASAFPLAQVPKMTGLKQVLEMTRVTWLQPMIRLLLEARVAAPTSNARSPVALDPM